MRAFADPNKICPHTSHIFGRDLTSRPASIGAPDRRENDVRGEVVSNCRTCRTSAASCSPRVPAPAAVQSSNNHEVCRCLPRTVARGTSRGFCQRRHFVCRRSDRLHPGYAGRRRHDGVLWQSQPRDGYWDGNAARWTGLHACWSLHRHFELGHRIQSLREMPG